MLDEHNILAKAFRMARDRFNKGELTNVKLKLSRKWCFDERRYNLPTSSEVAAFIIVDISTSETKRDIIVETQSRFLQYINELHPA